MGIIDAVTIILHCRWSIFFVYSDIIPSIQIVYNPAAIKKHAKILNPRCLDIRIRIARIRITK